MRNADPYFAAAEILGLDGRAAKVLRKRASRRRTLDIRSARRAKMATRRFLALAFA